MKTLLKKSATLKTISSKISTYLHEIDAFRKKMIWILMMKNGWTIP